MKLFFGKVNNGQGQGCSGSLEISGTPVGNISFKFIAGATSWRKQIIRVFSCQTADADKNKDM